MDIFVSGVMRIALSRREQRTTQPSKKKKPPSTDIHHCCLIMWKHSYYSRTTVRQTGPANMYVFFLFVHRFKSSLTRTVYLQCRSSDLCGHREDLLYPLPSCGACLRLLSRQECCTLFPQTLERPKNVLGRMLRRFWEDGCFTECLLDLEMLRIF